MRASYLAIVLGFTTGISTLTASAAPVELKHSPACIFVAVAKRMGIENRSDQVLPAVFVATKTPLSQFQDIVEKLWNVRPEVFVNLYAIDRNEIYLADDESAYTPRGRFIDDSLAHELAHFVQVKIRGEVSRGYNDDALEDEAVRVQNWFRETYMHTGKSPCALPADQRMQVASE